MVEEGTAAWHPAYHAARERGALFSLPESSLVALSGAERLSYLNSLCTNKVVDLDPGQGARAFLLNPAKGRVLADFLACAAEGALWLECAGGSAPAVLELLARYYFGQEVKVRDETALWSVFSLQGPESSAILERAGAVLPAETDAVHVEAEIGAHRGRIVRWSDTGEIGFHVWVSSAAAEPVSAAIHEAGAVAGRNEAWTVLQIEAGIAAYGRELTEETIPLEAPTENAISHTKGCYPGQEVIARLHVRGRPAKRLKGLLIEGDTVLEPGAVLDAGDKPAVARVTASGVSPVLGPIALAYVHRDYCEPGTRLVAAGGRAVEVADLPMIPVRAG
ncbi:MAG TPA: glycine cleavage T C-terminal barrel domain-containing protein [Gemmatimonadota bacterium]|nr:glycine cleavage T C-terminal barrel domain-containing protein [Gemmatimonadota bacterium]